MFIYNKSNHMWPLLINKMQYGHHFAKYWEGPCCKIPLKKTCEIVTTVYASHMSMQPILKQFLAYTSIVNAHMVLAVIKTHIPQETLSGFYGNYLASTTIDTDIGVCWPKTLTAQDWAMQPLLTTVHRYMVDHISSYNHIKSCLEPCQGQLVHLIY